MMKFIVMIAIAAFGLVPVADAQSSRKCGSFGYWRVGEDCINASGQRCTITGIMSGRLQLNCLPRR